MSSTRRLTTRARNLAISPDELKISHIKQKGYPYFVDIKKWYQNSLYDVAFVGYFYNAATDIFYAYVNSKMFKKGLRLPEVGEQVQICTPEDLLLDGHLSRIKTGVVSEVILKSYDFKTAKIRITFS